MGIGEVGPRFFRLNQTRTLHQHGSDDLEAVGDAMLEFLQQDLLFAHEVVPVLFREARPVTSVTASADSILSASK